MNKRLWGGFTEPEVKEKRKLTMDKEKTEKLRIFNSTYNITLQQIKYDNKILLSKNEAVTQTVEVLNQSDILIQLIDTYSNQNNYVLNPHLMPSIDYPKKAQMTTRKLDKKFSKPIWFINPDKTPFTEGKPKEIPKISRATAHAALRKSICGLVRLTKFSEIEDSALTMMVDAIDNFYILFLEAITNLLTDENPAIDNQLDVMKVEKAYFNFTNQSITSFHNYIKNEINHKNQNEINNFIDQFNEYDKLVQENNLAQNMGENLGDMY